MKVYISYGALPDQVTALRLQALGAAHGLTLYVPPAHTRSGVSAIFDAKSEVKLAESDVVLGVLGTSAGETCRQELNLAIQLKKKVIVMASPDATVGLGGAFGPNLIIIDSFSAGEAERKIAQSLEGLHLEKGAWNALAALCVLATGLMLLSTANAA